MHVLLAMQKVECSARRGRKPALPGEGDVCVTDRLPPRYQRSPSSGASPTSGWRASTTS